MIFAIVAAILAYNTANSAGRKGGWWALIALVAFIGSQLIVGATIGSPRSVGRKPYLRTTIF